MKTTLGAFTLALKASPEQMRRAARNTISRGVTYARQQAVNNISDKAGLKKKTIRDRMPIRRPTQTEMNGSVSASNKQLPMNAYPTRVQRISRTRAAVYVHDGLRGGFRKSASAFVNPASKNKRKWRRVKGAERYPLDLPAGPSVAVQFEDLMTHFPTYESNLNQFLMDEIEAQLRRQLKL